MEGGEEVLVGELLFGFVVAVGVIGEGKDELGVVVFFQLAQLHVLKGVVLGGHKLLLRLRALHVDSRLGELEGDKVLDDAGAFGLHR